MVRFHTRIVVVILCLLGTACGEQAFTGTNLGPAPSSTTQATTSPTIAGPVTGKYFGTAPTPLGYLNGVPMFQMAPEPLEVDGAVTGSWYVVDFLDGGEAKGAVEGSTIVLRLMSADSDYRIDGTLTVADGGAFSSTLGYCDTAACSDSIKPVTISFTRQ